MMRGNHPILDVATMLSEGLSTSIGLYPRMLCLVHVLNLIYFLRIRTYLKGEMLANSLNIPAGAWDSHVHVIDEVYTDV